jgi:hypothetical protein
MDSDVVPRDTERPPPEAIELRVHRLEDEFERLNGRQHVHQIMLDLAIDSYEFLLNQDARSEESTAQRAELIKRYDDVRTMLRDMVPNE